MSAQQGSHPPEEVRVVDPIDKYSALIVRGAIIGTGLLGLTLYVRNSRLFAKYDHVSKIPNELVRKEFQLKGIVRDITPYGYVKVEHRPVVALPSVLSKKSSRKEGLLNLRLAGLDISPAGLSYLTKDLRLANRPVTFTVIKPTEGNSDAADAEIEVKKNSLSRLNLNVDLIRRGYARVFPPEHQTHLKALQSNAAYSRLITRLLTSEKVADRRGIGVFERQGWVESLRSLPSASGEIIRTSAITKFIMLLFEVLRDFLNLCVFLLRQSYFIAVAVGDYAVEGYRRFGQSVDRLAKFYARQKGRIQGKPMEKPN
jgi:hypothetical protein